MNTLRLSDEQKTEHVRYQNQFATLLYADDAIKELINTYKTRSDFSNTIFIITGDHRMPEIPIVDKLDRYHVPFIVYSPLLKRKATFNSISTHLDVAPTFVSFMKKYAGIETPTVTTWIGKGIDTTGSFSNTHSYALKQTKGDLVDYVEGQFWLNGNDVFRIEQDMSLTKINDEKKAAEMKAHFNAVKFRNENLIAGKPLIPDSVYKRFNQF